MSGVGILGICFVWCCFGFFALARHRGLIVEILENLDTRYKEYPQGYNEKEMWHWILVPAGLIALLAVVISHGGGRTAIRIPNTLKDF